jgi:hypothetical protein
MTEHQRGLLWQIEDAFQRVELGDGVSLHETVVIDLYGSRQERRAAREPDEKHDWRKLVGDPELTRVCGLSFYDAIGLRFHLPAYLTLAVTDPNGEDSGPVIAKLLFTLTHLPEFNRERFAILSAPQRACIREVLIYLRHVYDLPDNGPLIAQLDEAIKGYWASER